MPSSPRAAWEFHLAMNEPLPPLRGTLPNYDNRRLFAYKILLSYLGRAGEGYHNAALSDGIGGALWLP